MLITGAYATLMFGAFCSTGTSLLDRSSMMSISPRSSAALAVESSGTMTNRTSSTSGRLDPV
ncbi:hypothetical protein D9M68_466430 [compost metagenome]